MYVNFYLMLLLLASFSTSLAFADLVDDITLLLKKGHDSFAQQRYDKAISYFDKVLEIEPNNVDALFNKGRALGQLNRTAEGMSYIEKVLEIEPDNVDALGYKGDYYFSSKQLDKAISYFHKVLKIEPQHVDALGVPYFDKVLEIEPDNVDALNIKGSSLVSLGRTESGITIVFIDELDKAISYFDKVLEIEPNNVDALFNKGRALGQLNRTAEGMSYIEKVLEIEPDNVDAVVYKGERLINEARLDDAMFFIDKALQRDPDHLDALFNKGSILARRGNFDEAISVYDQILRINPEYYLAAKNLELLVVKVGYKPLDGFLDVTVRNSEGALAAHLKVPRLTVLNHPIGKEFLDEWPVIKTMYRNGQEVEVLQYKVTRDMQAYNIKGGAAHYGITYPYDDTVWRVYANYWQYLVQKGDTVTFEYTVFRPLV